MVSSAVDSPPGPSPPASGVDLHRAARRRAYDLIRESQTEAGIELVVVEGLIEEAEHRGWRDVVRLGLYLGYVRARHAEPPEAVGWAHRLLDRAESDGDTVMTALALASRSQLVDLEDGRAPVDADRDLARAMVLLEGATETVSEAVSAHIEFARACEQQDLWELQLHHYDAAEACLDWDECGEDLHAVLLWNRAELEVNWVAALRERGDVAELGGRADLARTALRAAAALASMPEGWREELLVFGELLDAISPSRAEMTLSAVSVDTAYGGYRHLARAFTTAPGAQARAHADLALETIDRELSGRIYLLALARAVELESIEAGFATAGLRWGRELVARRWERRLATLASMQSLVEVERLSAEHALMQQHALLDDLTGLANRRALARFADGLRNRGVRDGAIALVDLDRFKLVNDTHGHAVGDEALSTLADILRDGVRDEDLVVRLGGDEFLLMLPLHDPSAARRRCEAIVERISAAAWDSVAEGLSVTASVGLAHGSLEDFDALFSAADAALYRAKRAGGASIAG